MPTFDGISDQGDLWHPLTGLEQPITGADLRTEPWNASIGRYGLTRHDSDGELTVRHGGIDLECAPGTPVYAAHGGMITRAGLQIKPGPTGAGYGLRVYVGGELMRTCYAHLSAMCVRDGDHVFGGQLLGWAGRTGNVPKRAKTHLHFGMKTISVDPTGDNRGWAWVDPLHVYRFAFNPRS